MNEAEKMELMFQTALPGNALIADKSGKASVMVRIPKQTYRQLGLADSDAVHPAFIVNGKEVESIYISKYACFIENALAQSRPMSVPGGGMNFDEAVNACSAKGRGWHLITKVEWSMLAQWCMKNGSVPNGNSRFGKDLDESGYKAIPAKKDADGNTTMVLTGTGPLSWSHDGTAEGIFDLKGNIGEWAGGARTVFGELQILKNNDGADSRNSQDAASGNWMAVDAATGELIRPDGKGTTPGSLKLELQDGRWVWVSKAEIVKTEKFVAGSYEELSCDETVGEAAKLLLRAYGFLKADETEGAYRGDAFYAHSGAEEKIFGLGGHFKHGKEAGVFCQHGTTSRTDTSATRGFRMAYVDPEEL